METLLHTLVGIFLAALAPIGMCIFAIKYRPKFVEGSLLSSKWVNLNLLSLGISIVLMISAWILYSSYSVSYTFIAALSAGIMGFVTVQTFSTDFALRLADRRLLRIANAISLIAGMWFLISFTDKQMVLLYLLLFLGVSLLLFVPALGQSDARAMQLVVLSAIPVIGTQGFSKGFVLMFVFILAYGFIRGIKDGLGFSAIITKMSIPMVPLIITPFIIMVLFTPLLPI